jgi:hypothetical protein
MKYLIIFILLFLNTSCLFCQETDKPDENIFQILQQKNIHSGKVKIYQDPGIESLVINHIRKNDKQNGFMGYRVQVYFGSGSDAKKKATEIKSDFSSKYPDFEAHIIYDTPNFKLRLGDFRTKNEAYKFKKELEEEYPSAFIVEDMIDFPKLN